MRISISDTAPRIDEGVYQVTVRCPNCRIRETVVVRLAASLQLTRGEEPALGVKMKTAKLPHECGQTALVVDPQTGEVLDLDDTTGNGSP